ncbi:zinc ribbon domain-containing protein [Haladaptatus sp.]|uniref:zinc ribbon domain-containing protein n=1 Tax=Haladaptatus sp. TaxID=1973141 RepID=UPI003C3EF1F4
MGLLDAVRRLFTIEGDEYRCGYCGSTFRYSTALAELPDLNCPYCGSTDIERVGESNGG